MYSKHFNKVWKLWMKEDGERKERRKCCWEWHWRRQSDARGVQVKTGRCKKMFEKEKQKKILKTKKFKINYNII